VKSWTFDEVAGVASCTLPVPSFGIAGPVPNLALLLARVSDEYQPEPASLMSLARTSTRSADAVLAPKAMQAAVIASPRPYLLLLI